MSDTIEALEFASDIFEVRDFMSLPQRASLVQGGRGEEKQYFREMVRDLKNLIKNMPATYGQDGVKDPTVYLHYFKNGSDWYITEKDMDGGVDQAFGYAILNGDTEMAEMGYISIRELASVGAELDLHFNPQPLSNFR